ncbi:hypothetical protein ACH5AO_35025 [Streptomyces sp. NPDC018964]|uniref:hypothetical protein n=1 Tax=unclassified Streptomyces TaxID=2593676 RepID=UPI0037BB0526
MIDTSSVGVFLGLDVGKSTHPGHGLAPAGKKVFDKMLRDGTFYESRLPQTTAA